VIAEAIERVVMKQDLDPATMELVFDEILSGKASEAQIAAFVVALRMKGETVEEIAAAARAMRRRSLTIAPHVDGPLLDTCGTGGDGLQTFNISTASAIVVAASGVSVAKHGNRAASSRTGSADVLEALGVRIDRDPEHVQRCIEEIGIGFLFAQAHHQALKHAAPVRRQLAGRTLFNVLGPLSNPAGATHQLIGVYAGAPIERLAHVLGALGLRRAWVVHGDEGLDEVSPAGPTTVAELDDGRVRVIRLSPADFGLEPVSLAALSGGSPIANAAIIQGVLRGEDGAPRIAVLINAASALCVAGVTKDPKEAAKRAAKAIDTGAAREVLERWVEITSRS
jgi:anthranilate phosphoribosyltransferase